MKKLGIVVAVVVLALLVAPWGVGKLAESRLNAGLDRLVEEAPYLKVVDKKWTGGWFKSEQVVTFEIFSAWVDAISPKVLEEAMKNGSSSAAVDVEQAGEPAVVAVPDAVPPSSDEAPPTEDAAAPAELNKLLRFTVRNEVLHGPVLGTSGFGLARVKTQPQWSEETKKKLAEFFGPKPPFEIITRIGFVDGGSTTFISEGRTVKPEDKAEISWETLKVTVGYSGNADHYDMKGEWPKFEVKGLEGSKAYVVAKDMSLEGDGKRVRDDLYDGLATFKIASLSFMGGDNDKVEISNIEYVVGVDSKDDFTNAGLKTGTGTWKSQQLATLGLELKEFHFDFGFRHLHSETLAKVMTGMKEIYTKPLPIEPDAQKVMFAPFKEQGTELLKYDPEFGIDRLGISTAEGDGYLKGVVTLKGATAEDFAAGSMGLIGKLHADFTVDVAEKLVQKFPNGSTAAGAAVDSGYVERKGDRLVCKILFKDGQLTVNGKPQAIPGLGGPPPMPPEGAPPPAE